MPVLVAFTSLWLYGFGLNVEINYCDAHPKAEVCKSYCAYHECSVHRKSRVYACGYTENGASLEYCER